MGLALSSNPTKIKLLAKWNILSLLVALFVAHSKKVKNFSNKARKHEAPLVATCRLGKTG